MITRPVHRQGTMPNVCRALVLLCAGYHLMVCASTGEIPKVYGPGERPSDVRLQPLKDLNGYFPFHPFESAAAWKSRADLVRFQMRVSMGLWPEPARTPLNPVIHGRVEKSGYTVEKVFFESVPGFFVTGNLYRPTGKTGKLPVVLSPHGHWANGRFYDNGRILWEVASGAERFEESGRSPLQARAVQLARMGCIVFHYDMIGYADSVQISEAVAHRFSEQRPDMISTERWGLFSPQAESHLQSVMGLQTWNSIRALDFVLGLPDADPDRVGVTGASGGGTQTFILAALDPRPTVSMPAVMVSTAMQGGCTCENASLLRVGTGNIEFAALFAPKPQGLTAADDWTKEMATKGFPELKQHYAMLGAPNNVMLKALTHFEHNYNYVSRSAMYAWFNKHLNLGFKEPVVEQDFERLAKPELTVWNDQHPVPRGGPDFERDLLQWLTRDAERQMRAARASLADFQALYRPALEAVIGRSLDRAGHVVFEKERKTDRDGYVQRAGLIKNVSFNEEVPALFLYPKAWSGRTVVWTSSLGKAGILQPDGTPTEAARALLESGACVAGVDLLFQGESLSGGESPDQTRQVKNPRQAAAYTFGYNHSLFAQRVHDLLSVVRLLQGAEPITTGSIDFAGFDGTGPIVAAARALCGDAIERTAIDTEGFRFIQVSGIRDLNFLPGGAKYGDLPGMLALGAPGKLWVAGEQGKVPDLVREIYTVAGAESAVRAEAAETAVESAAVAFLLK